MFQTNKNRSQYWESLEIGQSDIDEIYRILLEREVPLEITAILELLIDSRIEIAKKEFEKQQASLGNVFSPKETYIDGETVIFPFLEGKKGKVIKTREGLNPEFEGLKVIEIEFEDKSTRQFAANIEDHKLDAALVDLEEDPYFNSDYVKEKYGPMLQQKVEKALKSNEDLIKINEKWFPRSLLVDVGIGQLNLAEAILDEADGGPLGTEELMDQVEFGASADNKLLDFSFDLAMQEDKRFDEVGPAGETLWFLHAREPEEVKRIPKYLQYESSDYPKNDLKVYLDLFEGNVFDELDEWDLAQESFNSLSISLIFPHWRSGTLPLSGSLKNLFPTAFEAPRVKFDFVDKKSKEKFSGWVVRSEQYIYGLKNWYEENELMPGSLVSVEKSSNQGEIVVSFEKSRQNKEWLRTVLIGSDQGIVFAMLKHTINANFNERMAIAVPDIDTVDEIWLNQIYSKEHFDKILLRIMRQLTKLNPQGQVHAQVLYAAINIVRRCPPSLVLRTLLDNDRISHLGDLYFRLKDEE